MEGHEVKVNKWIIDSWKIIINNETIEWCQKNWLINNIVTYVQEMLYNTETPRGLSVNVGKYSTTTVPWESSLLCTRCVLVMYMYTI